MTLANHGVFISSSEAQAARHAIWATEVEGNLYF